MVQKNGYQQRVELFQNSPYPLIQRILKEYSFDELSKLPKSTFKQKYFDDFIQSIYIPSQNIYLKFQQDIKQILPLIQPIYPKMLALNESWGFKIWPKYQIRPDLFCCGGKYWPDEEQNTGIIILGLTNGISLEKIKGTIVHKMVHTGIEYLIVNPNHENPPPIKHFEKERIVDKLCCYLYKDDPLWSKRYLWSDGSRHPYQEATQKYSYMDDIVGLQPETNLYERTLQFLKKIKTNLQKLSEPESSFLRKKNNKKEGITPPLLFYVF